jgi:hypothetical protein
MSWASPPMINSGMSDLMERLLRDCEWNGDCLEWTGSTTSKGYGQFSLDGQHWMTHRLSWLLHNGQPPAWVLHTCDNPPCVNPEHLWSGTCADNHDDMRAKGRWKRTRPGKTHCLRDHPLSGDNLYVTPDGRPQCRECQRERRRAYLARQR